LENIGERLREGTHVQDERFASKGPRAIKDGSVEILVEGDLAAFEGRDDHFMAAVKFLLLVLYVEMPEGLGTLCVVPGIAE